MVAVSVLQTQILFLHLLHYFDLHTEKFPLSSNIQGYIILEYNKNQTIMRHSV